jgi:hypothetical protein
MAIITMILGKSKESSLGSLVFNLGHSSQEMKAIAESLVQNASDNQ